MLPPTLAPRPTDRCYMTTSNATATTPQLQRRFRLPDPPKREPYDMTSFDILTITGNAYLLREHLGNQETTLVTGEHYICLAPIAELLGDMPGLRYPDLLVAFGVDPEAYYLSNAYVISEQGKPPDFVLEIASPSTGRIDVVEKRDDYAALGIGEYWRFDETGESHGTRLAGDRLVNGGYVAIEIEQVENDVLQGYSAALSLNLRWERGELCFFDPETNRSIATLADERTRAEAAEARIRELEERLRELGTPLDPNSQSSG